MNQEAIMNQDTSARLKFKTVQKLRNLSTKLQRQLKVRRVTLDDAINYLLHHQK